MEWYWILYWISFLLLPVGIGLFAAVFCRPHWPGILLFLLTPAGSLQLFLFAVGRPYGFNEFQFLTQQMASLDISAWAIAICQAAVLVLMAFCIWQLVKIKNQSTADE